MSATYKFNYSELPEGTLMKVIHKTTFFMWLTYQFFHLHFTLSNQASNIAIRCEAKKMNVYCSQTI